jgi:hypothetical protein
VATEMAGCGKQPLSGCAQDDRKPLHRRAEVLQGRFASAVKRRPARTWSVISQRGLSPTAPPVAARISARPPPWPTAAAQAAAPRPPPEHFHGETTYRILCTAAPSASAAFTLTNRIHFQISKARRGVCNHRTWHFCRVNAYHGPGHSCHAHFAEYALSGGPITTRKRQRLPASIP